MSCVVAIGAVAAVPVFLVVSSTLFDQSSQAGLSLVRIAWPAYEPQKIESLGGAGGFSGASLWRISTTAGSFCLRRWPSEHPTPSRLSFIHRALIAAADRGLTFIPSPIACADGKTFSTHNGRLWELTPWMPGEASYSIAPTDEKLTAALTALAQFHQATKRTSGNQAPGDQTPAPSIAPGIEDRIRLFGELRHNRVERIRRRIGAVRWPELDQRAASIVDLFAIAGHDLSETLRSASRCRTTLQPCIRDIWHDHLLFQGEVVSGIVDFGATRMDCVAGDIARLLGSLVSDDSRRWEVGLTAYGETSRLTPTDRLLIQAYDRANVILSPLNWLSWIYLDGRQFDRPQTILNRLDDFLARMRTACASPPR